MQRLAYAGDAIYYVLNTLINIQYSHSLAVSVDLFGDPPSLTPMCDVLIEKRRHGKDKQQIQRLVEPLRRKNA